MSIIECVARIMFLMASGGLDCGDITRVLSSPSSGALAALAGDIMNGDFAECREPLLPRRCRWGGVFGIATST